MAYHPGSFSALLVDLLTNYKLDIARVWADAILASAQFEPGGEWDEMLFISTQQGLLSVTQVVACDSYKVMADYLLALTVACLRGGFSSGGTVQSLLMCKGAFFKVIDETPELNLEPPVVRGLISELDAVLAEMASRFVDLYIAEMYRRQKSQHDRKQSLLSASLQTPDKLTVDGILQQAATSLIQDLGVESCDFYLVDEDQLTCIPAFGQEEYYTEIRPNRLYPNEPFAVTADGFLYMIIRGQQPYACYNVRTDRPAPQLPVADDLKSMLVLPLIVRERVFALAIAASWSDYREFTAEQEEQAWNIIQDSALAVDSVQLYAKRQAENESIQRVMSLLVQDMALDDTLRIVCEEIQRLTTARGSAVYFLEDAQWLRFSVGSGDPPINELIPVDGSRSGQALRDGVGFYSNDPANDKALFGGATNTIANMLVVPLCASGMNIGILVATNKRRSFTDNDLRIVSVLANQAAVAIEHARLLSKIRYITILEERERLSREIHDNLAQALAILKLQASSVHDLLLSGQTEQALASLQALRTTADEAYTDAREEIVNLRNRMPSACEFIPTLEAYLARYRDSYGIDAQLDVQGVNVAAVPDAVLIQMTRIIQEALANIRKHAHAQQARVRLHEVGHALELTIEDDGEGFDVNTVQQTACSGFGLQIMQERAEGLDGVLRLTSVPAQGTRIVVRIPLSEHPLKEYTGPVFTEPDPAAPSPADSI